MSAFQPRQRGEGEFPGQPNFLETGVKFSNFETASCPGLEESWLVGWVKFSQFQISPSLKPLAAGSPVPHRLHVGGWAPRAADGYRARGAGCRARQRTEWGTRRRPRASGWPRPPLSRSRDRRAAVAGACCSGARWALGIAARCFPMLWRLHQCGRGWQRFRRGLEQPRKRNTRLRRQHCCQWDVKQDQAARSADEANPAAPAFCLAGTASTAIVSVAHRPASVRVMKAPGPTEHGSLRGREQAPARAVWEMQEMDSERSRNVTRRVGDHRACNNQCGVWQPGCLRSAARVCGYGQFTRHAPPNMCHDPKLLVLVLRGAQVQAKRRRLAG